MGHRGLGAPAVLDLALEHFAQEFFGLFPFRLVLAAQVADERVDLVAASLEEPRQEAPALGGDLRVRGQDEVRARAVNGEGLLVLLFLLLCVFVHVDVYMYQLNYNVPTTHTPPCVAHEER